MKAYWKFQENPVRVILPLKDFYPKVAARCYSSDTMIEYPKQYLKKKKIMLHLKNKPSKTTRHHLPNTENICLLHAFWVADVVHVLLQIQRPIYSPCLQRVYSLTRKEDRHISNWFQCKITLNKSLSGVWTACSGAEFSKWTGARHNGSCLWEVEAGDQPRQQSMLPSFQKKKRKIR